jgi:hypothetical protein
MKYLALIALLISPALASEQYAVMRWDSSCVHLTEQSYAEAPMKDGEPDYSGVKLHGLKLDRACGVIRVGRK